MKQKTKDNLKKAGAVGLAIASVVPAVRLASVVTGGAKVASKSKAGKAVVSKARAKVAKGKPLKIIRAYKGRAKGSEIPQRATWNEGGW